MDSVDDAEGWPTKRKLLEHIEGVRGLAIPLRVAMFGGEKLAGCGILFFNDRGCADASVALSSADSRHKAFFPDPALVTSCKAHRANRAIGPNQPTPQAASADYRDLGKTPIAARPDRTIPAVKVSSILCLPRLSRLTTARKSAQTPSSTYRLNNGNRSLHNSRGQPRSMASRIPSALSQIQGMKGREADQQILASTLREYPCAF
jgi:hypothetical protein